MLKEVPPHIGYCVWLKMLDLSNCGLTEIPNFLLNLSRLLNLDLSSNQIEELPEEIGRLTQLVSATSYSKDLPFSVN